VAFPAYNFSVFSIHEPGRFSPPVIQSKSTASAEPPLNAGFRKPGSLIGMVELPEFLKVAHSRIIDDQG